MRELDVHAVIVTPADGASLSPGQHTIEGWAWSHWPVRTVEVSADGGATWTEAQLAPRGSDHQWQAFKCVWDADASGRYELRARATDARARTQPTTGRNRIHTVSVVVA